MLKDRFQEIKGCFQKLGVGVGLVVLGLIVLDWPI
jgi:hypothetical protein